MFEFLFVPCGQTAKREVFSNREGTLVEVTAKSHNAGRTIAPEPRPRLDQVVRTGWDAISELRIAIEIDAVQQFTKVRVSTRTTSDIDPFLSLKKKFDRSQSASLLF